MLNFGQESCFCETTMFEIPQLTIYKYLIICFVGGSISNDLQFVAVPLITNENCIEPKSKYPSYFITSNMVCAGFLKGTVYIYIKTVRSKSLCHTA